MKRVFYILVLLISCAAITYAQNPKRERGGFSLAGKQNAGSHSDSPDDVVSDSVASPRSAVFRINRLGDSYLYYVDTSHVNLANRTLAEGIGIAVAHTGNVASPYQSRIFMERSEGQDFIFATPYTHYLATLQTGQFYDTKVPFSDVLYTRSGGSTVREEQFKMLLTSNFGKKLNVGGEFDYVYSNGHYQSNANKLLNYRFFASYKSNRYEAFTHFRNFNMVQSENGGITDDRYVTHPEDFANGRREVDSRSFPTRFTNVWNRVRSQNVFLAHRYNLGFYREMTENEQIKQEEQRQLAEQLAQQAAQEQQEQSSSSGQTATSGRQATEGTATSAASEEVADDPHEGEVFVPVSSIIHVVEYERFSRRFISNDQNKAIDTCYVNNFGRTDSILDDFTEMWRLNNTVALALREGFQDWANFGITAFVALEKRKYFLPGDSVLGKINYEETATSIGAQLSRRNGKLLNYNALGEVCVLGDDIGQFKLAGDARLSLKLMGKTAALQAYAHVKNLRPSFYQRRHHGRYFWWENTDFQYVRRVSLGASLAWEQTKTKIYANVENVNNYIFFGDLGFPQQFGGNLQIVTLKLEQNFRFKAFGWENTVVYQKSSNEDILPLPQLSAYTNVYVDFKLAKVLFVQLGADIHYHSLYYAPYYEPATQQFQTQKELKIGEFPLVNAYANFRLKQATFFVTSYNLATLLTDHPAYFSMPHYPINPMVVKLGVLVRFNN